MDPGTLWAYLVHRIVVALEVPLVKCYPAMIANV
jgi:hypothetical protein